MKNLKKILAVLVLLALPLSLFAVDSKVNFSVDLSYPYFENDEELNEILRDVVDDVHYSFYSIYKNFGYRLFSSSEASRSFSLNLDSSEIYSDDNYISFYLNFYFFTGGANGFNKIQVINYDKNKKKLINFKKFFGKDYKNDLKKFSEISEKSLVEYAKNKNIPYDMVSIKNYTAPNSKNYENFIITSDGVKFIFNQGSVFAYAYGNPEVNISSENY